MNQRGITSEAGLDAKANFIIHKTKLSPAKENNKGETRDNMGG
jgi:hypothetical protein